jgi:uncharacterized protein (DUF433 family)
LDTIFALAYRSAMHDAVVSISPEILSGVPVFPGTRVPVQTLLDYLEAGDSINEFLSGFPSVSRLQVVAFLERAASLAVTDAA